MSDQNQVVIGWQAAAKFVGKNASWMRRQVAAGRIRAEKNEAGENVFVRSELEALRPPASPTPAAVETPVVPGGAVSSGADGGGNSPPLSAAPRPLTKGELYAAVFEELDAGKRVSEIVRKLKVPVDEVLRIVAEWKTAGAADLNAPSVPAEIATMTAQVKEAYDFAKGWREWADVVDTKLEAAGDRPGERIAALQRQMGKVPPDCGERLESLGQQIRELRASITAPKPQANSPAKTNATDVTNKQLSLQARVSEFVDRVMEKRGIVPPSPQTWQAGYAQPHAASPYYQPAYGTPEYWQLLQNQQYLANLWGYYPPGRGR
jgi:hypothetical protein